MESMVFSVVNWVSFDWKVGAGALLYLDLDILRVIILHFLILLQWLNISDYTGCIVHLRVLWCKREGMLRKFSDLLASFVHQRLHLISFSLIHLSHGLIEEIICLICHLFLVGAAAGAEAGGVWEVAGEGGSTSKLTIRWDFSQNWRICIFGFDQVTWRRFYKRLAWVVNHIDVWWLGAHEHWGGLGSLPLRRIRLDENVRYFFFEVIVVDRIIVIIKIIRSWWNFCRQYAERRSVWNSVTDVGVIFLIINVLIDFSELFLQDWFLPDCLLLRLFKLFSFFLQSGGYFGGFHRFFDIKSAYRDTFMNINLDSNVLVERWSHLCFWILTPVVDVVCGNLNFHWSFNVWINCSFGISYLLWRWKNLFNFLWHFSLFSQFFIYFAPSGVFQKFFTDMELWCFVRVKGVFWDGWGLVRISFFNNFNLFLRILTEFSLFNLGFGWIGN